MIPTYRYTLVATPAGPFSLALDAAGGLAGTAFGGSDVLAQRLRECRLERDDRGGAAAAAQVLEYFRGERRAFDLPLAPVGSAFQQRVWAALARIPFGETRSYRDLAQELESAPRAIGRANASNPICLIVPCHRVIGADGSLTGFAFGTAVKELLLRHEAGNRSRNEPHPSLQDEPSRSRTAAA